MSSDEFKKNEDEQEISLEQDENLDDSVIAEEAAAETIKKLRDKLKACTDEKQQYLDGWQRAKADLINARKRDESDRKDFIKFANEQLIYDLLPTIESFERAISNKEAWEKVDKNWRIGVEYIYNGLKKTLTQAGLSEIDPLNQKFDHNVHEATSYVSVNDETLDHVVIEVFEKGFTLNGRLLKPAKVKVGEYMK